MAQHDVALTNPELQALQRLRAASSGVPDAATISRVLSEAWRRAAHAPLVQRQRTGSRALVAIGVATACLAVAAAVFVLGRPPAPTTIASHTPVVQDRPSAYPLAALPEPSHEALESIKRQDFASIDEELTYRYGARQSSISSAAATLDFAVLAPTDTLGRDLTGVYIRTMPRVGDTVTRRLLTLLYGTDVVVRESRDPAFPSATAWVDEQLRNLGPLAQRTSVRGIPAAQVTAGMAVLTVRKPGDPDSVSTSGSSITWIEGGALYSVSSDQTVRVGVLLSIARSMIPRP